MPDNFIQQSEFSCLIEQYINKKIEDAINEAIPAIKDYVIQKVSEYVNALPLEDIIRQGFAKTLNFKPVPAIQETTRQVEVKVNTDNLPKVPSRILKWYQAVANGTVIFVKTGKSVSSTDLTYYKKLFEDGLLRVDAHGGITGPDFYIRANGNDIYPRKRRSGRTRTIYHERCMLYTSFRDADEHADFGDTIYYCRVTVPRSRSNGKQPIVEDTNFPAVYIVSQNKNKHAVKNTYRDYITNSDKYVEAILKHTTKPGNYRHTSWSVNVQAKAVKNEVVKEAC